MCKNALDSTSIARVVITLSTSQQMGFWPTQYTYTHSLTHIEYKARALTIPCNRKRNEKKKQNNRKKYAWVGGTFSYLPSIRSQLHTHTIFIYFIPLFRVHGHVSILMEHT